MKKRIFLFFAGVIFTTLFVFLSFLVEKDLFTRLDFDLTVKIQDHISRRFDYPFSLFSLLGSFEVITAFFVIILLLSLRRPHRLFLFSLFILLHIIEVMGKIFIYHPGPPFMFLRYRFGFNFPSSFVHTKYAYPSGHMARTAFLISFLSFLVLKSGMRTPLKIFLVCFLWGVAFLMMLSRIYLGEHWFSDTLGGLILGVALSFFLASLW